jgi:ABC-type multidrug transport system fused ATPase/permease subunit
LLPSPFILIVYRIDTIMDCDQLLVLSNGELVETGVPTQLASASGGMFAGMVAAAKAAAAKGAVGE